MEEEAGLLLRDPSMLCQYFISKGLPTEDTDGCISHEMTGPMRDKAFWSRPNPEKMSAYKCGFGPFDDFTFACRVRSL